MKIIGGIRLYDVEDLVRMLEVSRITVQAYLRTGRLKGVKIGKRWHVAEQNLKDFLSGNSDPRRSG